MKTDIEINEIMRRFNCSKEEATNAPKHILQIFPTHPLPLSEKEIAFGKMLAKTWNPEFIAKYKQDLIDGQEDNKKLSEEWSVVDNDGLK